jgi:para-aminobenzoate synthetase/4-amino-4-deoxychorismate lyase
LRLRRTGAVAVDVEPFPAALPGPVLLALDDDPVDPYERWLYHKTTFREPYERRRLRRPDVDDVIMVNTHGELTEVSRATLALDVDGTWCTPPLSSGCLPGVERARLLDRGVLHERVLRHSDLEAARGLAVISSLRGWRTARLLVSSGPAAEGGDDVRREHQVVGRDSGRPGPAVAGQLHP